MPVLDIANMTDEQLRKAAQGLAGLGTPQQMDQMFPGLGGPNVGQQLAQQGVQPQQSPLIPGGAGGIPAGAGVPLPQGPQNPIPPQNMPIQAAPLPQQQAPDMGKILAAMSAVRPVQPPEVVNPPSGDVAVGNASLAQALIPGLFNPGVGRPLPIRLTN